MKNWLKGTLVAVGIVSTFSLLLAGCHTKLPFTNSSKDVLFNGGIVVSVDDNLIFSNGYKSDSISSIETYNSFASSTYLAYTKTADIKDRLTSPNVNKIKGEVTGYSNIYNFVYGNYVYYAKPNTHKKGNNQYDFTTVSFCRANFSGGDTKELFFTNQYDSAKAVVRALQFEDNAYLVVFDGTDLHCVNLNSTKKYTVASDVGSVAIPREKEVWNGNIYYTKDSTDSSVNGNVIYKYDVKANKSEEVDSEGGYTTEFVGRSGDEVFYKLTNEKNSSVTTCLADASSIESKTINTAGKEFYTSSSVSNIYHITDADMDLEGYLFTSSLTNNPQVMYRDKDGKADVFLENGSFSNILFTYGDLVYFSTTDGIYYKSISSGTTTSVVSGMTIIATKAGYDYYENGGLRNIYFYAQRVYSEDDETAEEDRDTNYYLYAKDALINSDAYLVGKTVK